MSRPRAIGLLLALATLLAWLPATNNGFVNFDDDVYVTKNSIVEKGFTVAGIKWAFTHGTRATGIRSPGFRTWPTVKCFGLNPAGHHLVSILFHAANSALLFALIWRLSGALWPSVFVAALFAWHPLHVESVAWVVGAQGCVEHVFCAADASELCAVCRIVQSPKSKVQSFLRAGVAGICAGTDGQADARDSAVCDAAFGLLAFEQGCNLQAASYRFKSCNDSRTATFNLRLLTEKIPFFLLSSASCIVTFLAQKNDAVVSLAKVPLSLRLENAITSFAGYLVENGLAVGSRRILSAAEKHRAVGNWPGRRAFSF